MADVLQVLLAQELEEQLALALLLEIEAARQFVDVELMDRVSEKQLGGRMYFVFIRVLESFVGCEQFELGVFCLQLVQAFVLPISADEVLER